MVITTHDMDEAATLSDRVAIIDHGTLLALDTPHAGPGHEQRAYPRLHGRAGARRRRPGRRPGPGRPRRGAHRPTSSTTRPEGWRFRVAVDGDAAGYVAPVAQLVTDAGARLTDVRLGEPNLEDVFIHLTGRALR